VCAIPRSSHAHHSSVAFSVFYRFCFLSPYYLFLCSLGQSPSSSNTWCTDSRNTGSVPSRNVNNLSYFSRTASITEPLTTVDPTPIAYDPTKTYIAFVVGDGDNLAFVLDGEASRKAWIKERVTWCETETNECFPLSWTLSPHLLYAAPDIMKWYYGQALSTGADSFVLPPSGHLYSYPGTCAKRVFPFLNISMC
jgi:hypothetical protein